jgi:hypothetical protein
MHFAILRQNRKVNPAGVPSGIFAGSPCRKIPPGASGPESRPGILPGVPSKNFNGLKYGRAACNTLFLGVTAGKNTGEKIFWPTFDLPRSRFAAASVAVLPVLHFPELYQKATSKRSALAVNWHGPKCGSSGTFPITFWCGADYSRETPPNESRRCGRAWPYRRPGLAPPTLRRGGPLAPLRLTPMGAPPFAAGDVPEVDT